MALRRVAEGKVGRSEWVGWGLWVVRVGALGWSGLGLWVVRRLALGG